jgi:hypothetical protein
MLELRMEKHIVTRRTAIATGAAGLAVGISSLAAAFGNSDDAKDSDAGKQQGYDLTSSSIPTIQDLDPDATSLGSNAYVWHGDDLPRRVGGPPLGYVSKTYITEWKRGRDSAGYMSFGPYFRPAGVGSLFMIRWIMSLSNRGGADEDVITVDCVDHDNGGTPLFPQTTFKVRQFPSGSDGFVVFSKNEVEIKPAMNIETRVFAHGGASLVLFQLRYDVHYL